MNCCNANGDCTQGKDCPVRKQRIKEIVRKQRIKEINDAYTNGFKDAQIDDPIDDLAHTFKGLITLLTVVLGLWITYLIIWGK